jgi:hypothetical protein
MRTDEAAIVRGTIGGLVLLLSLVRPAAHAQTTAYLPDVITGTVTTFEAVGAASRADMAPITPASTLDGHSITSLGISRPPKAGPVVTHLFLGKFSSDPGPSYLQSLTCTTAGTGTITLTPSSGTFSRVYTSATQTVAYGWKGVYPFFLGSKNGATQSAQCTISHSGQSGWIRPKYEVVGLVYAPPGSKSTVTYMNGFQSGTNTSTTNTYSSGYTEKVTISAGFKVPEVASGTVTASYANGWGQTQEGTSSVALSETYSTGLIQGGPLSSALGVDHDFDVVYVWLNPEELIGIAGKVIARNGFGWDERDSATTVCGVGISGMDVAAITLGQLRGTQAISASLRCRLNRVWDSSLGALTSADLLEIANADPFYANPQFNPNTANSARYERPNGQNLIMNYIPAAAGQQPTGYTYTSMYSSTTTLGQTATDMHSTSWSVDLNVSANFLTIYTASLAVGKTATYTTTNKNSSTITKGTSQGANFTIYGPAATDNYTGPTAMQVWKDNIYGTFMFFPEN